MICDRKTDTKEDRSRQFFPDGGASRLPFDLQPRQKYMRLNEELIFRSNENQCRKIKMGLKLIASQRIVK